MKQEILFCILEKTKLRREHELAWNVIPRCPKDLIDFGNERALVTDLKEENGCRVSILEGSDSSKQDKEYECMFSSLTHSANDTINKQQLSQGLLVNTPRSGCIPSTVNFVYTTAVAQMTYKEPLQDLTKSREEFRPVDSNVFGYGCQEDVTKHCTGMPLPSNCSPSSDSSSMNDIDTLVFLEKSDATPVMSIESSATPLDVCFPKQQNKTDLMVVDNVGSFIELPGNNALVTESSSLETDSNYDNKKCTEQATELLLGRELDEEVTADSCIVTRLSSSQPEATIGAVISKPSGMSPSAFLSSKVGTNLVSKNNDLWDLIITPEPPNEWLPRINLTKDEPLTSTKSAVKISLSESKATNTSKECPYQNTTVETKPNCPFTGTCNGNTEHHLTSHGHVLMKESATSTICSCNQATHCPAIKRNDSEVIIQAGSSFRDTKPSPGNLRDGFNSASICKCSQSVDSCNEVLGSLSNAHYFGAYPFNYQKRSPYESCDPIDKPVTRTSSCLCNDHNTTIKTDNHRSLHVQNDHCMPSTYSYNREGNSRKLKDIVYETKIIPSCKKSEKTDAIAIVYPRVSSFSAKVDCRNTERAQEELTPSCEGATNVPHYAKNQRVRVPQQVFNQNQKCECCHHVEQRRKHQRFQLQREKQHQHEQQHQQQHQPYQQQLQV